MGSNRKQKGSKLNTLPNFRHSHRPICHHLVRSQAAKSLLPAIPTGEDQSRSMAVLPSKSYPRAIGKMPRLPVTCRVRVIGQMSMLSVGYRQ